MERTGRQANGGVAVERRAARRGTLADPTGVATRQGRIRRASRLADQVVLVSLSSTPWHDPFWRSRQFLMYELAQHIPVVYAPGRTYVRELSRLSHWKGVLTGRRPPAPFDPPPNLTVVETPLTVPSVPGYPLIDRFLARRFGKHLSRRCLPFRPRRILAYVWEPGFVDCLAGLEPDLVVYHPYDKFDLFDQDPASCAAIRELEHRLLGRADAVIAPSRRIAESLHHPNTHVVHNGVFLAAFNGAGGPILANPLDHIPPPRIGYVGVVNAKVDFRLLLPVARARPEWSLVLVGPVRAGDWQGDAAFREIRDLPNVHFLPPASSNRIVPYLTGLEIGVMPYDLATWAGYCESPLKLYQYWAAGVPVVSSALPNLAHRPGLVSIAETAEQWTRAIEWELRNDSPILRHHRLMKALESSWTNRANQVLQIVRDLLEARPDNQRALFK